MLDYDSLIAQARQRLATLNIDELIGERILPAHGRFKPVVIYPQVEYYPETTPDQLFIHEPPKLDLPTAAYVHIPFCAANCVYCHWVKMIDPPGDVVDSFLLSLIREMELAVNRYGVDKMPVTSAIFGGGTPTFLSPNQLRTVLAAFTWYFDLSSCRQFSFEAEPTSILGTFGEEKLRVLRDFGVDRISLGVQSFQDDVLREMGRPHTADQARQAIAAIRKAGFGSISIDLIYGYPRQTINDWIDSLQSAATIGVDAWQLYRLRVERHGDTQGVILNRFQTDPSLFPSVEQIHLMKMIGIQLSEQKGYGQHFTRIFATAQKHVTQFMWDFCCNLTNVIGIGPSAWSNHYRTFAVNTGADYDRYRNLVNAGKLPVDRGLYRDTETELRRSLITPLKNDHVYKKAFALRTGFDVDSHFAPEFARLERIGLLARDEKTISLTEKGRFFADETVTQLFQKKYLPFPELAHDLTPE